MLATGLGLSWRLKIVVERIHVLEYGLLGYLAARDVFKKSIDFTKQGILPDLDNLVWYMLMGIPEVPAFLDSLREQK